MPQFDHHSPEFALSWRTQYEQLRTSCPVAHIDAHGGFTVLTTYADVKHALLTPREFVCGRDLEIDGRPVAGGVTIPPNPFRMGMMEMDPPESLTLRRILMPWFSAHAVDVNSPHIRDLVTWCLDRVIESGHLDVVDDLANPLPAVVTLDLMGLPLRNWQRYAHVLHEAAYRAKGSAKGVVWLLADLREIVEQRRETPAAVMTPIDALLAAEVDGVPLSIDLVVELVFMLLNGGIDTSTAIIAHSLRYLSANPAAANELRATPELIPAAVEELLRYFTPGTGVARTAITPTRIGDADVEAGERLLLALGAANLDPEQFPQPDTVDFHRDTNRHLSFGAGVHRCLGSFLAPRELAILLEEVLRRMPDLLVDEAGVRPYPSVPLVAGFQAMPASFTPGPRLLPAGGDEFPPERDERARTSTAAVAANDLVAP